MGLRGLVQGYCGRAHRHYPTSTALALSRQSRLRRARAFMRYASTPSTNSSSNESTVAKAGKTTTAYTSIPRDHRVFLQNRAEIFRADGEDPGCAGVGHHVYGGMGSGPGDVGCSARCWRWRHRVLIGGIRRSRRARRGICWVGDIPPLQAATSQGETAVGLHRRHHQAQRTSPRPRPWRLGTLLGLVHQNGGATGRAYEEPMCGPW